MQTEEEKLEHQREMKKIPKHIWMKKRTDIILGWKNFR